MNCFLKIENVCRELEPFFSPTGTLKKKEILTHDISWMNPKDIVLSEISQSQKDKCCMIPLLFGT